MPSQVATLLILLLVTAAYVASAPTVVVCGGGVAGLSAAHELIERGFNVKVYERQSFFGGKARSVLVEGSGTLGREDLPGEHGFRFFPGMYFHIDDILKRIPFKNNKNGVYDNLVNCQKDMLARMDKEPWVFPTLRPKSSGEFLEDLKEILHFKELNISAAEMIYFSQRMAVMASTCDERWVNEYDNHGYWDFMHAADLSPNYADYLVKGITLNLVAAKAELCSLKTTGRTFIRLVESAIQSDLDRVLNGPTNDAWLKPWVDYLRGKGVEFYPNMKTTGYDFDGTQITAMNFVNKAGNQTKITGDYYLTAIPIERFVPLITPEMAAKAPSISQLHKNRVEWMNGIMFYMKRNTSIVYGHVGYFESPWALTSVSQQQFWPYTNVSKRGDGTAVDIVSVDISDWNAPGFVDGPSKGLPAKNCTKEQIAAEVWYQLHRHLPQYYPLRMEDAVSSWYLDTDIVFDKTSGLRVKENEEPLMVNVVHSWNTRPEATTEIKNLFLASDFVKTTMDIATMESANEAARLAVNGILKAEQRTDFAKIFDFYWPSGFKLEKELDCFLYKQGKEPLGWNFPVPKYNPGSNEHVQRSEHMRMSQAFAEYRAQVSEATMALKKNMAK